MRRSFSRDDSRGLEQELFDARSRPRPEFLNELALQVESAPAARVRARRPRFAAALVFAVVVLAGLASFGGAGYAKSSITSAVKSSEHVVSKVVKSNKPVSRTTSTTNHSNHSNHPSMHQYSHFVLVCYPFVVRKHHHWVIRRHTIVVLQANVGNFVPPGSLGPCGHN